MIIQRLKLLTNKLFLWFAEKLETNILLSLKMLLKICVLTLQEEEVLASMI